MHASPTRAILPWSHLLRPYCWWYQGNIISKLTVPPICMRSAQLTQNHNQTGFAWYPRRAVAAFPVERSSEVTLWRHRVAVRFLPITFDRNELETWGWCHSVSVVKAHRLICNMTYLSHTVTLTWRDLRSNFKNDLSRIKSIWIDPAWREEHDGVKLVHLP